MLATLPRGIQGYDWSPDAREVFFVGGLTAKPWRFARWISPADNES